MVEQGSDEQWNCMEPIRAAQRRLWMQGVVLIGNGKE
nr:MAG TPA: hypothetical protein [Caudoviricetes sp.]